MGTKISILNELGNILMKKERATSLGVASRYVVVKTSVLACASQKTCF